MSKRLCHYCKQPMTRSGTRLPTSATWDHRIPKSLGGTSQPSNKVRSCRRCNIRKSDYTEEQYVALMKGSP